MAKEEQKLSLDSERAWKYLQHADTLHSSRLNFALVAESMLVVAFFIVPESLTAEWVLRLAITVLGLVYTLGWFYVNARLSVRMQVLHRHLKANDTTYHAYLTAACGPPANSVLTWVLPLSTLGFWLVLLWATLQK